MRFEEFVLADVACQHVVGGKIAAVEGKEEVAQPAMRGLGEGVEDGMQEEFSKVVDGVRHQSGDAEIVRARDAFFLREVFEVNAGEIEESILVVRCEFFFGLSYKVSVLAYNPKRRA